MSLSRHHETRALAYALWEIRQRKGFPGDALQDWHNAETIILYGSEQLHREIYQEQNELRLHPLKRP